MILFDETIRSIHALTQGYSARPLPVGEVRWQDMGNDNLILRSDMAYELGGNERSTYALGVTAVTESEELAAQDELLLIGKDLPEIKEDTHYARIAVVRFKPGVLGEGNALYNAIKKVEFVRYHTNPDGFMTRVSLMNGRESARVGRDALNRGLTFSQVGNLMLSRFHENPDVAAVQLLFITDPAFPYAELAEQMKHCTDITKALDHLLQNVRMDCDACGLKKVCEEVETLCEKDFAETAAASAEGR